MDNGGECKYSCKTASEPLEWIHAIVHFLKPYRFFLNAHVVNFFKDSFLASFALGWLITNGAGLASFPIDTVRRRMMMTSGEAAMYKSSMDAFTKILKNEGSKSLFKGAGANILLVVAGHGVLVGYNKL